MFEKNFKPAGDRLLIKLFESESKTASGLIIPDAAKEKARTGTVLATGPGRRIKDGSMVPMAFKSGDVVYFGKYAGTDVGQEDLMIVKEEEILGVLAQ
jgi:chaperonin GroES